MAGTRKQAFISGNRAAAEAVRLSRVQVIPAYPITPQTHLVEYLSEFVNNGELEAEFIRVESEHSAMSAAVGASVVGARAFTATSSQGLQYMSETLYFASGLRMPVVICVAHRSLAMPISIWTDQQDTLVNRDSGCLQVYCATVQEIFDWTIQMFKICEHGDVSLPGIVAYDGFIVSHVAEQMEMLSQDEVDEAIGHINKFGSGHSEAIVSNNKNAVEKFFKEVDAACLYSNTSTRFTDGSQFGLGGEIGISTQKLHARGPMGIKELTTYKWLIKGKGQIRA